MHVFDAIDAEFLASPLVSVTLVEQGECGDGLPERPVTVGAARDVVHDPTADLTVCDAVFAALVRRAQSRAEHSRLAAVWVMLPGLRAIAHRLRRTWRTDVEDIRSDVVIGFLDALRDADPDRRNLGAHLWWTTYRHARRSCEKFSRETAVEDIAMLAARTESADHANNPPAEPIRSGAVEAASPVADARVEGERLGSIAHRFGLHDQLQRGHRSRSTRHGIGYLTLHNSVRSRPRATGDEAVGVERRDDAA